MFNLLIINEVKKIIFFIIKRELKLFSKESNNLNIFLSTGLNVQCFTINTDKQTAEIVILF